MGLTGTSLGFTPVAFWMSLGGWATSTGSITRVVFGHGHEITGGAPLLALFEKWPAREPAA